MNIIDIVPIFGFCHFCQRMVSRDGGGGRGTVLDPRAKTSERTIQSLIVNLNSISLVGNMRRSTDSSQSIQSKAFQYFRAEGGPRYTGDRGDGIQAGFLTPVWGAYHCV